MARISLRDLDDRVRDRFDTIYEIAAATVEHPNFRDATGEPEIALNPDALLAAVEAYFLINTAYKSAHGIEFTEPPKIAAMTAIALADFQPLRLRAPSNVRLRASTYANEHLSLVTAAAIFAERMPGAELVGRIGDAGTQRLRRLLKGTRLATLGAFRGDVERGERQHTYDIRLPYAAGIALPWQEDLAMIEAFVLFFERLWNGQDGWRD